jgi:hypothetical protein
MTATASREDFEARLRQIGGERYHDKHPAAARPIRCGPG